MNKIKENKNLLRKKINSIKNEYTADELHTRSLEVLSIIEITGIFQEAKHILIYNNMKDEVETLQFINKWKSEKTFYLPVVIENDIVFREYSQSSQFEKSTFGIMEPTGDNLSDYGKIDLIIIPGVAFDRNKNRLGRGKGYYDRFLKNTNAPKMGICFDFQLIDKVPTEPNDVKMDFVISENDFIW